MEILFLCVVIFLFLLAVFDLSVGVSNDAVNFLNSAIGSKAASFKRVLIVASIGVFIGGRKRLSPPTGIFRESPTGLSPC